MSHSIRGRWLRLVAAAVGIAAAAALVTVAQGQATDRTVLAGTGQEGYAVNIFGPSEFTVATGSTVTFENPWFEPHTVTFTANNEPPPAPNDPNAAVPTNPGEPVVTITGDEFVNAGFLFRGDTFQATFPEAGSYDFFCIIHPGMQGTVTVSDDPDDADEQADMSAEAQATFDAALTQLKAEAGQLAAKPVTAQPNADGTTTWLVNTVGGMVGTSDVQQFFPPSMDVEAGDKVVFQSEVVTPHTVTFAAGPPPFPEDMMDPLAEPTFLEPSGPANAFGGEGFVHSGVIGVNWPAGQSFSVTFTEAGSFQYVCLLHAEQGMMGVVNVAQAAPPAATPAPSDTGSAGVGQLASDTAAPVQIALAAAALAIVSLAALVMRRRRA